MILTAVITSEIQDNNTYGRTVWKVVLEHTERNKAVYAVSESPGEAFGEALAELSFDLAEGQ